MKKKIIIFIALISVLLPINVKALTGSINLSCDKTKLNPNEETTCYVKGNINEEVSGIDATLVLGDNLTLSSITKDSIWDSGDVGTDSNKIVLVTSNNPKGNFNVVTFKVKAGSKSNMDTKISLSDVKLSNATDFTETDFTVDDVKIRIPSTVNTLSSLTVSGTTFNFNENTTSYELEVDSDKVTISATRKDTNSVVSGDTGSRNLKYGLNTFYVKVTSESGSVKTYTLKITRPDNRSKENYMLSFKFSNYDVDFSKDKTNYDLIVNNKITRMASCYGEIDDDTILCIDSESLKYSDKANVNISINGKNLNDLFDEDKIELKCNDDETSCEVYFENNKIGMVEYKDDKEFGYVILNDLKVGNNQLKVIVTAENEEERTYTFNINRKDEEGKVIDKTEEEITSNSKTGSIYIIIVGIVLVVALVVLVIILRRKNLFNKEKNN